MPNIVTNLKVNRVDFVDEGANSAAFIELYKRKELCSMDFEEILAKMKPEHAAIVQAEVAKQKASLEDVNKQLNTANQTIDTVSKELDTTKNELGVLKAKQPCECTGEADAENVCKSCGLKKAKAQADADETEVLKNMPEPARELFLKMRAQKEVAEETLRKEKLEKQHAEAVVKAASFKSLPVDNAKLIEICKKGDPDVLDVLTAVNAAIDGVVLKQVGTGGGTSGTDAWAKIEAKAADVAKRDNITKQRAVGVVIKEFPDLYRDYLNGGAN